MRTGKNPAKSGIPAYTPRKLGMAIITYIPSIEGYFKQSLEILNFQIETIRASTPEYDLLVFDNGSCSQAVTELQSLYERQWIDWLVSSKHNLGKAGAWNWIFAAMPNELICYADSDVLFRPGWLESSAEILEAFPRAGMVAAQPNFFDVMEGQGKAHLALQNNPQYEFISYNPRAEIVDEFCLGIAASDELAAQFHQTPLPAINNREQDLQAVIGASHMQFLIRREVARQVIPLPATRGLLRKETMSIDFKIDDLGYLHLSTLEPYVFHMGNTINSRLLEEIQSITGNTEPATHPSPEVKSSKPRSKKRQWLIRLARQPRINRLFMRIYNLLFQVLHAENQ